MKNLFLSLFMILLIPIQAIAYDWNSEEGFYYMTNEDYQIEKSVEACVNLYDDMESAKKCSYNAYDSYKDMMKSIEFLIRAEEEFGVSMDEHEICISKALNRYWNTDTNTANWYRVRKYAIECIEK